MALQAAFTLWSQVGGEYHLSLVFWPWKLGIRLRVLALLSLLAVLMLAAGALSYDAHLNEPADVEQGEESTSATHHARQTGPFT